MYILYILLYIVFKLQIKKKQKKLFCFLWEVYFFLGTELIPLLPLPQRRSFRKGGEGIVGIPPGSRFWYPTLALLKHLPQANPDLEIVVVMSSFIVPSNLPA